MVQIVRPEELKNINDMMYEYIVGYDVKNDRCISDIDKHLLGIRIIDAYCRMTIENLDDEITIDVMGIDDKVYSIYKKGIADKQVDEIVKYICICTNKKEYVAFKDLLTTYSDKKWVCCSYDKRVYDIPEKYGIILMKNNYTNFLYSKIELSTPFDRGNTVEVLKQYLNKEKSIYDKLQLLGDDAEYKKSNYNYYVCNSVYDYLVNTMNKIDILDYDCDNNQYYLKVAIKNNISAYDLRYRIKTGVSEEEAIKLGIHDRDKYGAVCEINGNYNYAEVNVLLTMLEMKDKGLL
jgi:hypothetical protein